MRLTSVATLCVYIDWRAGVLCVRWSDVITALVFCDCCTLALWRECWHCWWRHSFTKPLETNLSSVVCGLHMVTASVGGVRTYMHVVYSAQLFSSRERSLMEWTSDTIAWGPRLTEVGVICKAYIWRQSFIFYILYTSPPPNGATAPSGRGPPHYRGSAITLRHATLGKTTLDEWSAPRRDLYLTTHNT
jgi:hypothetical protein